MANGLVTVSHFDSLVVANRHFLLLWKIQKAWGGIFLSRSDQTRQDLKSADATPGSGPSSPMSGNQGYMWAASRGIPSNRRARRRIIFPPSPGLSAAYSTSWAAAPLCGWWEEEGGSHNTFHKLLTAVSSTALYCTPRSAV